jgi:ferredoxin-NADP reductase
MATVVDVRVESPTAHTLGLDLPGWAGHLAGQHVDVRLTAPDGYRAQRSYSIADATVGTRVEITVQVVPDGEVSSYLVEVVRVGDEIEVRGPIGGYFVWGPGQAKPLLLVAGGSGVVPLRAILRARCMADVRPPVHLVYAVRDPESVLYKAELSDPMEHVEIAFVYSRVTPPGWPRPPGRLSSADLTVPGFGPDDTPDVYVCGPTAFVETVADLLIGAGHAAEHVRTERFG